MTSARDTLWLKLKEAGLVGGDVPARAESSPWFVRVMLGFAGWLGAIFLLLFVGVGLAFIIKSAVASLVVGALACAAAALLYRLRPDHDFVGQFALAVSLAGQALLASGWSQSLQPVRSVSGLAAVLAVQEAVLFFLVPNFLHRVLMAWWGAYAAVFALSSLSLGSFGPAIVTVAFIVVWLREFDHARRAEIIRAAGYGLALAAVQGAVMQGRVLELLYAFGGQRNLAFWWAGAAASGAVLLWAVVALLRREGVALSSGPGRFALAGAAVIALASLKAPGIGPATAILVIGYANGNRLLVGLGVFALIGYVSVYYYSMQATLLEKSALLAVAGIALLLARLVLKRWWPLRDAEAGHA